MDTQRFKKTELDMLLKQSIEKWIGMMMGGGPLDACWSCWLCNPPAKRHG